MSVGKVFRYASICYSTLLKRESLDNAILEL